MGARYTVVSICSCYSPLDAAIRSSTCLVTPRRGYAFSVYLSCPTFTRSPLALRSTRRSEARDTWGHRSACSYTLLLRSAIPITSLASSHRCSCASASIPTATIHSSYTFPVPSVLTHHSPFGEQGCPRQGGARCHRSGCSYTFSPRCWVAIMPLPLATDTPAPESLSPYPITDLDIPFLSKLHPPFTRLPAYNKARGKGTRGTIAAGAPTRSRCVMSPRCTNTPVLPPLSPSPESTPHTCPLLPMLPLHSRSGVQEGPRQGDVRHYRSGCPLR